MTDIIIWAKKNRGSLVMKDGTLELINELKKENNTIILAHNYQIPEIQNIADYLGDSLGLAKIATKTNAENIIFCGVDFMAESAKILNPEKNVIHPDIKAKCPMAAMVDAQGLKALKDKYPNAEVVTYVNTSARVKALSGICCTSSNGVKVVKSVKAKDIIFVPDENLGLYIRRFVKDKNMILWPGMCPTHHNIKKQEILDLKNKYPKAEILVHPECRPEIIDIADYVFSTNGMLNHAKKTEKKEFIIGTEKDLCYRLKKEIPNKIFYPLETAICPDMKKITLEKVLNSLKTLEPKLIIPDDILIKAKKPLNRMVAIGRGD